MIYRLFLLILRLSMKITSYSNIIISSGYVIALCLLMTGCKDNIEDLKPTTEERAHVLAVQNPFGKNLVHLVNAARGTDVLIGMRGCKVYRAQPLNGVVTEWQRVDEVDALNFLAAGCDRQDIRSDGTHVYVSYCTAALAGC